MANTLSKELNVNEVETSDILSSTLIYDAIIMKVSTLKSFLVFVQLFRKKSLGISEVVSRLCKLHLATLLTRLMITICSS